MSERLKSGVSRRAFIQNGLQFAALAAIAPGLTRGFRQQQAVSTAFSDLRRGVGYFTGRGGTIGWLVNKDAAVVVDTQFPETAALCIAGLEKKFPGQFDLLIDSHHHADHTSGNPTFRPKVKHILAQANVPGLQKTAYEKPDGPAQVYADQTYEKEWSGAFGDETVRLRYWGPGHTNGDSIIHFEKANVVHTGDLVFNYVAPFIDTKGGASTSNWVTIVDRMYKEFSEETIFIFGHGSAANGITGTRKDILVMRNFLTALLEHVQAGVKAGKNVEEIAAIDALPKFESYSAGDLKDRFKNCIRQTYAQLVPPTK